MRRRWLLLLLFCLLPASARAGYDHYFKWKEPPDKEALEKCIAEMAKIVAAEKSELAGEDGTGQPTIEKYSIVFNGKGKLAHEPFVFPDRIGLNSCKTQWKPYDRVVTACLLVARDHFSPEVLQIASDGSWSDWEPGATLYTHVTGRPAKSPLADLRQMFNITDLKRLPSTPPADDADDCDDQPAPTPKGEDYSLWLLIPLVAVIGIVFVFWRRDAL